MQFEHVGKLGNYKYVEYINNICKLTFQMSLYINRIFIILLVNIKTDVSFYGLAIFLFHQQSAI